MDEHRREVVASGLGDPARSERRRSAARRGALLAVPVGFLAIFFAYPVASIIGLGLRADGRWQLDRATGTLTAAVPTLWFTVWQAAASTVLTLAIALPGAYVFARVAFRGKALLRAAVTVPFVLPTVVVGAAFLALIGPGTPLRLDNSIWAILAAHVFFNYAVVVRTVGGLWSHLDPRQEDAARVLGASRFTAWRAITLPALAPAIAASAVLVFLFTFTSFGVIQVLGGPRFATLEVEIYRQTAQLLDLPAAAVLSLLQFAVVTVLLGVHAKLARRRESSLSLVAQAAHKPQTPAQRAFLAVNLGVMALLLGAPIGVLIVRSAKPSYYQALTQHDRSSTLFVPAGEAIGNSLGYAAAATAIALVIGGLAAAALTRRAGRVVRTVDALLMLPLGVSAVTVGFGFLITLDEPPLDLRASPALVPLAQALVAVPFVVRTVLPVLRAIDVRLREAAAVLGASPLRAWREVDLPIARRAVGVAAGFAFAISLGEFGATIFLARPDTPTLPIAIYRLLSRPGELNYGQAMALSTVLVVLCAGALLALERVRLPGGGEF